VAGKTYLCFSIRNRLSVFGAIVGAIVGAIARPLMAWPLPWQCGLRPQ
jgi:hypothetical protein